MSTFTINNTVQNINFNGNDVQKLIFNGNLVWQKTQQDSVPAVKFTAKQANSTIGLSKRSSNQTTLQYSRNGSTWTNMWAGDTFTLTNSGDSIYVRGVLSSSNTTSKYTQFTMSGNIKVSGNINYLWNKDNPDAALKNYCGCYLFRYCTALTDISELEFPTTTLTMYCYYNMFRGCTGLTNVPSGLLPATTLADACYTSMFYGCYNLNTAPVLPATTLASNCYSNMFYDCYNLNTAPDLLATTLTTGCYYNMFSGCTNLNYIKCLATDISASSCLRYWVSGVAATGTFVKDASMTGWVTGYNGIPDGWTVQNV